MTGLPNAHFAIIDERRIRAQAPYGLSFAQIGSFRLVTELDPIVLTRNLLECGLEAGDVGWVVMLHGDGAGYEVEFVTLGGETISVVTVPASGLRAAQAKEIAHARVVA